MVGGKRVWVMEDDNANVWRIWNRMKREDEATRDGFQIRFPDITVVRPDGKKVVIDCKFDRKDGSRDQWGTKPGVGSGQDQKQDYNDINKQEIGASDQSLSIDADVCKCPKGKKDQKRVGEEDPNFAEDWAGDFWSASGEDADAESPSIDPYDPYGPPFIGPPPPPLIGPPPPPQPRIGPPPPPKPKPPPKPFEEDDDDVEDVPDSWKYPPRPDPYRPGQHAPMVPITPGAPGSVPLPEFGPFFEPIPLLSPAL